MTWLDSLARRLARSRPDSEPTSLPATSPSATSPSATSRRDFLKKAGIVGGLAWSVPVLQTVMAPAASASVGTPLGGACNDLQPCANGNAYCNGSICGGVGATCTSLCAGTAQCSSRSGGPLTCGGPGSTCSGNGGCTENNCGLIPPRTCGGRGATCSTNSDCATGRTCQNTIFGRLCRT